MEIDLDPYWWAELVLRATNLASNKGDSTVSSG